jgi:hypothetical protein
MCNKKKDILADDIEAETGRKLTNRHREFARYYVEGIYSNAECARKAGYASSSAASIAGHLLAGKKFPHTSRLHTRVKGRARTPIRVTVTGQLKPCMNYRLGRKRLVSSQQQSTLKRSVPLLVA